MAKAKGIYYDYAHALYEEKLKQRIEGQKEFTHTEIEQKVRERYPKETADKKPDFLGAIRKAVLGGEKPQEPKADPKEIILAALKKPITLDELAERTKLSKRVVTAHIEDLRAQAYNIDEVDGMYFLQKKAIASEAEFEHYQNTQKIRFAVVSDTHIGNKHQQIKWLNEFYDTCQNEGIKDVYHCGDISDGFYKIRPTHIYELFLHGFDRQADYIIDNYPKRKGITTHFITGNHDNTHIMNGGANIGQRINREREDMNYLGLDFAKIWLTPKCDMDLVHPGDGTSYALSYKPQKRIDAMQGGAKPRIMFIGHYHKMLYMPYRNIHAFLVPCFEAQTPFMRSKALYAEVGGLIIEIDVDDTGEIKRLKHEYIKYYRMNENDY